MNAGNLITEIYYAYRGKGASRAPVWGEEKSQTALAIANRKQREWAQDSDQAWASNFSLVAPNEVGTVATNGTVTLTGTDTHFTDYRIGDKITVSGEIVRTIATIPSDTSLTVTVAFSTTASSLSFKHTSIIATGVQSYSLNRKLYTPSDSVIVTTTQSQDLKYVTSAPMARDEGDVYISGRNPKILTFASTFTATNQAIGGELKVAGYYLPDALVNEADLVAVDDPNWLVYATAAELARNDPAKDDQFGNLLGIANDLYSKMVSANTDLGYLQGGSVPYNMPMIGDQTGDSIGDW